MLTIVAEGTEDLVRSFQEAGVELPQQFRRAMVVSVIAIKQTAQEKVPVKTGALKDSIQEFVQNIPLVGEVRVGQPYGLYVEHGTEPHVIEPVNGKALRFVIDGNVVFAKKVNHPGSRAKPFMQPAFDDNYQKVQDYFKRAVVSVLAMFK